MSTNLKPRKSPTAVKAAVAGRQAVLVDEAKELTKMVSAPKTHATGDHQSLAE
ncbi:MAG: hypothetical protein KGL90_13780 [Burkholderiales bacterium]|nr:hypothetical protein [Burkholderiales bacterium]